jgi:transposase-like protein
MQGFKSPSSAQRFVAIHAVVYNIFNAQRHLTRRATLRRLRAEAYQAWNGATAEV